MPANVNVDALRRFLAILSPYLSEAGRAGAARLVEELPQALARVSAQVAEELEAQSRQLAGAAVDHLINEAKSGLREMFAPRAVGRRRR